MSDLPQRSAAEMARQARQHLDSLKAAGVDWLPAAPAPQIESLSVGIAGAPTSRSSPARTAGVSDAPPESAELPETYGTRGTLWASAEETTLTVEQRRQSLKVLAERVSACTRCADLAAGRTQTVFGVGKIGAEICFVGEAPGADEDAQGEPFVGAAGQLLNRIMAACGMKREEVYICNILKCRPPGNRLPLAHEAANCREFLEEQLELVRPKFICALGACAAQNLLGVTASIGKLRGRFHDYRGIPVLCTYHPAYLLRNPAAKKDVWEDMKKLLKQMGRQVK